MSTSACVLNSRHSAMPSWSVFEIGLVWWVPGMLLVTAYFVHTYRRFSGKVSLLDEDA